MLDAVISHQSGRARAALQVAGASPTVVDRTQEHIASLLLTPSRVTAAFQGSLASSGPWKTSCATHPWGGKPGAGGMWGSKIPADPVYAPRTGESQPGNYKAPGAPIEVLRRVRSRAGFSSLVQHRCKFGFVVAVLLFHDKQLIYRWLGIWLLISAKPDQSHTLIFHWRSQRAAAALWNRSGFQRHFTACPLTAAEAQFMTFCYGSTFLRTRSSCGL